MKNATSQRLRPYVVCVAFLVRLQLHKASCLSLIRGGISHLYVECNFSKASVVCVAFLALDAYSILSFTGVVILQPGITIAAPLSFTLFCELEIMRFYHLVQNHHLKKMITREACAPVIYICFWFTSGQTQQSYWQIHNLIYWINVSQSLAGNVSFQIYYSDFWRDLLVWSKRLMTADK